MPFGSNIRAFTLADTGEKTGWTLGKDKVPVRPVEVPVVEPPPWWFEYLRQEWERKHGLVDDRQRRDSRTSCQRASDEWQACIRVWDLASPRRVEDAPLHRPWGSPVKAAL